MNGENDEDLALEAVDTGTAAGVAVAARAESAVEQLWGSIFLSPERTAPKSITVTAAESREGATQVATALALTGSSAEHGLRIALVDFNVRRPMIARIFGIRPSPGVAEVITKGTPIDSALVPGPNQRLNILPAGGAADASPPLLQSRQAGELITRLSADHDHLIIDAPAVNRSAIAQALAGYTDGVLIVTKAGVTRRESVAEAKKRIEYAQGKVIGVVLNQRQFPIPGFLYRRL